MRWCFVFLTFPEQREQSSPCQPCAHSIANQPAEMTLWGNTWHNVLGSALWWPRLKYKERKQSIAQSLRKWTLWSWWEWESELRSVFSLAYNVAGSSTLAAHLPALGPRSPLAVPHLPAHEICGSGSCAFKPSPSLMLFSQGSGRHFFNSALPFLWLMHKVVWLHQDAAIGWLLTKISMTLPLCLH